MADYKFMRRIHDGQIFAFDYRYEDDKNFEFLTEMPNKSKNKTGVVLPKYETNVANNKDDNKTDDTIDTPNILDNTESTEPSIEQFDMGEFRLYTIRKLKDYILKTFHNDVTEKIYSKEELVKMIYECREKEAEKTNSINK